MGLSLGFRGFTRSIKNGGEDGGKRNSKGRFALGHSDMQVRKANLCLNRIEPFVYLLPIITDHEVVSCHAYPRRWGIIVTLIYENGDPMYPHCVVLIPNILIIAELEVFLLRVLCRGVSFRYFVVSPSL